MALGIISIVFKAEGCSEEEVGRGEDFELDSGLLGTSGLKSAELKPGLWVVVGPLSPPKSVEN